MQQDSIERLGMAIGGDYYSSKVAAALLTERPYDEVFKIVPSSGCYDPERWGTMVQIHQMVIAWRPSSAHDWLTIATKPLLSNESDTAYAYVTGTILGLLKGGRWLDEHWQETTEFQKQLLLVLAQVVCGPAKLQLHPRNLDVHGYGRSLSEAIRTYVFPNKDIPGRSEQLERAVAYIRQHGEDKKFSALDQLIIERLCHGILARRPATQKIAAAHFILSSYGAQVTTEPDCGFLLTLPAGE